MYSDIIIRNIKLHILCGVELKDPYLSIYNELKDIFSDLNVYVSHEQPHRTYYGISKKEIYMFYSPLKEITWLDKETVCKRLENKFNISNVCVKKLTTWYLNEKFGFKGFTQRVFMEVLNLERRLTYKEKSKI